MRVEGRIGRMSWACEEHDFPGELAFHRRLAAAIGIAGEVQIVTLPETPEQQHQREASEYQKRHWAEKQRIETLRARGMSWREVAADMGVSRTKIRRIMGIEAR